jgi:outer membrane protein TolC
MPNFRKIHRGFTREGCVFVVLAVGLAAVLAGCTTLAPTEPYREPPKEKNVAVARPVEQKPPNTDGRQETPEPLPAQTPLTLEACLEIARRNNPELSAAGWDAAAAKSEKRIKAASRWPNIHATGSYFHYQDDQRLVAPTAPGAATYFSDDLVAGDIVLRLPLYAGGRIVNEIRAAELLFRASEHTVARTSEELVFNVTSTYYSILSQRHVVESLEFSREVLSQHLERVNNLIAAQKAAKVDALRTEVRLADLDQQLLQAKNVYEIQHRFLVNQMGMEEQAARDMNLAGDLPFSDTENAEDAEKVVVRAYAQRHDYAAAMAALEAQARRVDIARGEREPEIALEASYGGRWGIGGSGEPSTSGSQSVGTDAAGNITWTRTSPLSGGDSLTSTWGSQGLVSQRYTQSGVEAADNFEDVGRVGVAVDVPIFEGGRIRAQIAKERSRLNAAQQRLRKLELQIRLEVETAVLNANSARERISVTRKSIAEAEESLRIERQKYDFGKGAIVDVLDAQGALLNAQTNYFRALADYSIAKAQVQLAAGNQTP